jgi:dTDP-4-dehydrorhamnose reductase
VNLYVDAEVFAFDHADFDITENSAVESKLKEINPDLVINCAAYNSVDKAEEETELANKVNGIAPGFMAKVCKDLDAIFVHYSTGQVFDGSNSKGYNEDAIPNPMNAYGKSKLLGETETQKAGGKYYVVRTAWLYGKTLGKKSFNDIMIEQAAKGGVVKAVSDEYGSPTYVVDLAHATRALVEENKPFGIYHLINDGLGTRFDWAQEIFRIKNIQVELNPASRTEFVRKAARPQYEFLNNTKFIKLRPWQEALEEFISSN